MKDPYFSQSEVSNSDLSWLKKYEQQADVVHDIEKAYRFGTLVDAIVTEPYKVNYFNRTVLGVDDVYSLEEFEMAKQMLKAFRSDPLCQQILKTGAFQTVHKKHREFNYEGVKFEMDVRCKWDFFFPSMGWGCDLKSTTATTQKQFEEACRYFDYDRQRAWYMDIVNSDKDMLIGISKVNFKVFKVHIKRGDEFYQSGLDKYNPLAFKYWMLFDNNLTQNQN